MKYGNNTEKKNTACGTQPATETVPPPYPHENTGFLDEVRVFSVSWSVPYMASYWNEGTECRYRHRTATESSGSKLAGTFPYIFRTPSFINMGSYEGQAKKVGYGVTVVRTNGTFPYA